MNWARHALAVKTHEQLSDMNNSIILHIYGKQHSETNHVNGQMVKCSWCLLDYSFKNAGELDHLV